MFRWFEQRLDPLSRRSARHAAAGPVAVHSAFSRGAKGYMLVMAACAALIAVAEVVLFIIWARW